MTCAVTISAITHVNAQTTDYILKWNAGVVANTSTPIFDDVTNNRVGIGTITPEAYLSLDGQAAHTFQMDRSTTNNVPGNNFTIMAGGARLGAFSANMNGGSLLLNSGIAKGTGSSIIQFSTATAGATGTADRNPTPKMTILGNGFVGIGTTTPGFQLDVVGSINLTDFGALFDCNAAGDNANESVIRKQGEQVFSIYAGTNTFVGLHAGESPNRVSGNGACGTNHNTFIGWNSGTSIGIGAHNVFVGESSGAATTIGIENVFIGDNSGAQYTGNSSGAVGHNVFVGHNTGAAEVNGADNVFVGHSAGIVFTGNEAVFIGSGAGQSSILNAPDGVNNTYIGTHSGNTNTDGSNNTYCGFESGRYNFNTAGAGTKAAANTLIGANCGTGDAGGNSHFYSNTFVGTQAGLSMRTGNQNSYFGSSVGRFLLSGTNNILIGRLVAGTATAIGDSNTFVGTEAVSTTTPTIGQGNTIIGAFAGQGTTANDLTFVGTAAGLNNTTGIRNSFIGYRCGNANSTGGNNTFLGYYSAFNNTTADSNTFTGSFSGFTNTTGNRNTFYGTYSGFTNNTSQQNSFYGFKAGFSNTVDSNTFAGAYCGFSNSTGTHNTFLGTTAGFSNTTGVNNTFLGFRAGYSTTGAADSNTFVGNQSGFNNSSASNNTFVGHYSGFLNTTGDRNTYIGLRAGYSSTTVPDNTFVGHQCGARTTGRENVYVGSKTGFRTYTSTANSGARNVLIGYSAGTFITSSDSNTYVGHNAGANTTTGAANSALGSQAGPTSSTLRNTTSVGANSAVNCSDCMVLGNGTGTAGVNYHVGIGNTQPIGNFHVFDMAGGAGSNDIRFEDLPQNDTLDILVYSRDNALGQGRVYYADKHLFAMNGCTTNFFVPHYSTATQNYVCGVIQDDGSNVGISTTASNTWTLSGTEAQVSGGPTSPSTIKLDVNGLLRCATLVVTSDERFKKNITPISNSLDKILKLKGVSYNMRKSLSPQSDFEEGRSIGFLAQEVEKIIPEAIGKDQDGNYGMNYNVIIPVLAEAIKEQQKQLEAKDEKIAQLENRLNDFENSLSECCMNYQQGNDNSKILSNSSGEIARLEQNNPNPFTDNTSVKYFIPSQSGKAILKIYSLSGTELKSFTISDKGTGQITISGNTFSAGTYVYNLIVDDRQVDSKYMTLTK